MLKQLLHDTVELKEQTIILQQLQAVIKKNNLNTIDAVDDIAHMCNNYTKQMSHNLPLYMCGACGMRQFVKPKVRSDQRYLGYRYMYLKDLDPLLKFSISSKTF